jgi:hypothetical protein
VWRMRVSVLRRPLAMPRPCEVSAVRNRQTQVGRVCCGVLRRAATGTCTTRPLLYGHLHHLGKTHMEKGRLWKWPMPSSATPWK